MKCPWVKKTIKYQSYHENVNKTSGNPVDVIKEEFGDCIGPECPYFICGEEDSKYDNSSCKRVTK